MLSLFPNQIGSDKGLVGWISQQSDQLHGRVRFGRPIPPGTPGEGDVNMEIFGAL